MSNSACYASLSGHETTKGKEDTSTGPYRTSSVQQEQHWAPVGRCARNHPHLPQTCAKTCRGLDLDIQSFGARLDYLFVS